MGDAKVYNSEDIKKILAERHGVNVKNIIRSQYSYVVVLGNQEETEEANVT